jgi:hypothetical protein
MAGTSMAPFNLLQAVSSSIIGDFDFPQSKAEHAKCKIAAELTRLSVVVAEFAVERMAVGCSNTSKNCFGPFLDDSDDLYVILWIFGFIDKVAEYGALC